MSSTKRWGFQRSMLPTPLDYYSSCSMLQKFKPNPSYTKATACCPFHNDRNPSFLINLETGAFKCFSCNTKGGGIVDYHMNLHMMDFKAAAQDLGAWA